MTSALLPTSHHNPLRCYILAGGRSRRFGSDKARHTLGGIPMLAHVARLIEPFAAPHDSPDPRGRVTVVADREDRYADLGFRTVADAEPFQGPLSGILTALADAIRDPAAGAVLICACDLIGLKAAWIGTLLAEASRPDHPVAVTFRAGEIEPFPGIYALRAEPLIARTLAEGERSPAAFLSRHGLLIPAPDDWGETANINRETDLP